MASLFLFGDELTLWSAHQFKTSREAFRHIEAMCRDFDHLRKRVKAVRTAHGEEGIELLNGHRLNFMARSRTSGRGFSGDCLILDEAQEIDPEDIGAILPTLSARPNPQIIYAGTVKAEAEHLRRVVERGVAADEPRLCVVEYGADPEADRAAPETAASANPSFGGRLDPEFVAMERASMPEAMFDQERLGIWPPRPGDVQSVIPMPLWLDLTDADSQLTGRPVFALSMQPDRSTAAIAVAGSRDGDDLTHVEVVDCRSGSAWIADQVVALVRRWDGSLIIDQRDAAAALLPEIVAAKIRVRESNTSDMAKACGLFYDAAVNDQIRHLGQSELTNSLAGAPKRDLGDAWAWSRKNSPRTDLSPIVAATLAHYGHVTRRKSSVSMIDLNDFLDDE